MSKTLGLIPALGEPKATHVPVLTKEEWVRSGFKVSLSYVKKIPMSLSTILTSSANGFHFTL